MVTTAVLALPVCTHAFACSLGAGVEVGNGVVAVEMRVCVGGRIFDGWMCGGGINKGGNNGCNGMFGIGKGCGVGGDQCGRGVILTPALSSTLALHSLTRSHLRCQRLTLPKAIDIHEP